MVAHESRAVLGDHLRDQGAMHDDVDFGAPRVRVRGIEAAGAEEAERHADACADKRGEDLAVCFDGVATEAGGGRIAAQGLIEVEDEIRVCVEEF